MFFLCITYGEGRWSAAFTILKLNWQMIMAVDWDYSTGLSKTNSQWSTFKSARVGNTLFRVLKRATISSSFSLTGEHQKLKFAPYGPTEIDFVNKTKQEKKRIFFLLDIKENPDLYASYIGNERAFASALDEHKLTLPSLFIN